MMTAERQEFLSALDSFCKLGVDKDVPPFPQGSELALPLLPVYWVSKPQ